MVNRLKESKLNYDKLKEILCSKSQANLIGKIKRVLERCRSVLMIGLQEELNEFRNDRTQDKIVITETIRMKEMTRDIHRTRRMGVCSRRGKRQSFKV